MATTIMPMRSAVPVGHSQLPVRPAVLRSSVRRSNSRVVFAQALGKNFSSPCRPSVARSPVSLQASSPAVVASAASPLDPVDPDYEILQRSTGTIKNVSFLAFWIQLALSLSSGAVLVFSVGLTQTGAGTFINVMSLAGVVLAFLSTFFAFRLQRLAKKLTTGQDVKLSSVLFNLNTTNTINLTGIASAVVGLQAAVGTLVGKTLMTQPQFGVAAGGNNLVSLDVFSLQALTNTLMAHFIALIFGSILIRSLTKSART